MSPGALKPADEDAYEKFNRLKFVSCVLKLKQSISYQKSRLSGIN